MFYDKIIIGVTAFGRLFLFKKATLTGGFNYFCLFLIRNVLKNVLNLTIQHRAKPC